MGSVTEDRPSRARLGAMNQEWSVQGESYRGVLLFQFRSIQPAPDALSHYVIEEGKEDAWRLATDMVGARLVQTDDAFAMDAYKNIHKQDTDKWPDLLHGLEIPMARALLQRYVNGNFWRTAWCTKFGRQRPQQKHRSHFCNLLRARRAQKDNKSDQS